MPVNGLEIPGYEPRGLKTMGPGGLAGDPGAACHNRSSAYKADFSQRVARMAAGQGSSQDLEELRSLVEVVGAASLCGLGQMAGGPSTEPSAFLERS